MIKFVLWVLVAGAAFCVEALALMWVTSQVHDWWAMVPTMDFGAAFGVAVALSCALSVWKLAEAVIVAVNEL
jgi:hypothetical protein